MRRVVALLVLLASPVAAQDAAYRWDIPAPFPRPYIPADNPVSAAKVELGRHLFYDRRLSVNGRQSCGDCHRQELAFTDGRAQAMGTTGEAHPRSSMSLANIAYAPALAWGNPHLTALEEQARVPLFGTKPIEMGLNGEEQAMLARMRADTTYRRLFAAAYPGDTAAYDVTHVVRAIASFERTLVSMRAPYDRYRYGGDRGALSESAKRGELFFFSGQRGGCFQCHGGWNFSGAVRHAGDSVARAAFFNTGLYNLPGALSYPAPNTGVHEFTQRADDVGRFRAPTLRNIAVTAPYMHDGSIATLSDVLDHYAAGGRTIASGARAGVGHDNPNKARAVHGFTMTPDDKRDLIAFLESLTDSTFLRNPAFANPWPRR